MKCIKCNKEATKRYSPDLDIKGIAVCDDCEDEVSVDLMLAITAPEFMTRFEKKYKLKSQQHGINRKIN